jgi:hypothetical protein
MFDSNAMSVYLGGVPSYVRDRDALIDCAIAINHEVARYSMGCNALAKCSDRSFGCRTFRFVEGNDVFRARPGNQWVTGGAERWG